jgi:hypothetical protein
LPSPGVLGGFTDGRVGLLIGQPLPMRHGRWEKKGRFSVVAVARLRLLLPEEHPRLHFQAGHVGHLIVHFIFFFFLLVFFFFFFRVEGWTQSQIDGRVAPVVAAGLTAAAAAVPADEAVVTMTAPAAAAAAAALVFIVVAGDSTDATLRCGDVIRLIGNVTAAAAVGVP